MTEFRSIKDETAQLYRLVNERPSRIKAVGSKIRKARLEMGASAEAFATALGMPLSELAGIERGLIRISAAQLNDASQQCNKPISYFFFMPEPVICTDRLDAS